jgi:hypothetical protein
MMVPLPSDKREFNNAILKLLCQPFEGMILHSLGFLEVGRSKPLVNIFHLVPGRALVCFNLLLHWMMATTLFLTLLNQSCSPALKAATWTATLIVRLEA